MTDEKKPSQLRRAADREVERYFNWSRDYDAIGANEYQRPAWRWPQFKMPRQPMAALPPSGSIFVDGQRAGPAPPEWSQTKGPRIDSIPTPPLTEEQEREQRRERKARELADRQARSAARREREAEEAARAGPPQPTMSAASKKYFLKMLDKRERGNW